MSLLQRLTDVGNWQFVEGQGLYNGTVNLPAAARELSAKNTELSTLRERVKKLETAAAKLVNCHEQDEDGCVHAKDINVAVYDVPSKFARDKALEDLAFTLGADTLKGEAQ